MVMRPGSKGQEHMMKHSRGSREEELLSTGHVTRSRPKEDFPGCTHNTPHTPRRQRVDSFRAQMRPA